MLIKKPSDVLSSEITPKETFVSRRQFVLGAGVAGASLVGAAALRELASPSAEARAAGKSLGPLEKSKFSTTEPPNSFQDVTTYNNFYEFGYDKGDPAKYAHMLSVRPWTVEVDGLVHKPRTFDIDEMLKLAPPEERIYRLRCVEAWSIVVPWAGYSLSEILKRVEPMGKAKYVEFTTIYRPGEMPGQRRGVLDWPYHEGLRLDEALHPLTLVGLGLYGELLPKQNGAPVRIIVPWKYGFKSAKSIVRIRLTEEQPRTTWSEAAPSEYGFYSNVNPNVDHPRWSQATERRLGEFRRRETLMFNGYGDQVAGMYAGMDLRKYY